MTYLEVDTILPGDFALDHSCPGCDQQFKAGDQAVGIFSPAKVVRIFVHTRCMELALHAEAPPHEVERATTSLLKMERQLA